MPTSFWDINSLKQYIQTYFVSNCRRAITANELQTALLGILQFISSGGGGDLSSLVLNEVPAGLIDGSNATFFTAFPFTAGSVQLFLNGLEQKIVDDYNTSGTNTITLVNSPGVGEKLLVNYIKS